MGGFGVYTRSFVYERNENCLVCSSKQQNISISRNETLADLIEKLKQQPFKLNDPIIMKEDTQWLVAPKFDQQNHEFKKELTF